MYNLTAITLPTCVFQSAIANVVVFASDCGKKLRIIAGKGESDRTIKTRVSFAASVSADKYLKAGFVNSYS